MKFVEMAAFSILMMNEAVHLLRMENAATERLAPNDIYVLLCPSKIVHVISAS